MRLHAGLVCLLAIAGESYAENSAAVHSAALQTNVH